MTETPPPIQNQPRRMQADLALFSVSVIWGSAFVVQRIVAPNSSAFLFNGLRFLLAALVLSPLVWLRTRQNRSPLQLNWQAGSAVFIAGLLLACGAFLQQIGMRYTTAGNAGFITGLYVVIIPIIQAAALKQPVRPALWGAALLAAIGLFLLSTNGQLTLKLGDALEVAGAFFWALHVIWIGQQVKHMDGLQLAVGQYLVCGITSIFLGLLIEPHQIYNMLGTGWAIIYAGIISVGLGYTLQIYGQKTAPPTDAAILLSLEAVFAALFGWLFLNEALTMIQITGCLVMLAGMFVAQASNLRDRSTLASDATNFSDKRLS